MEGVKNKYISWFRLWAVIQKEMIQIKRDRLTFAMIIGLPLMQLILFGFAINTNPKNLPTGTFVQDYSAYTRDFIQGMKHTEYFKITEQVSTEEEADRLIRRGKVLFVVSIPSDFSKRLVRNEKPSILVEADATDPVATGAALSAIEVLARNVLDETLKGRMAYLQNAEPSFEVIVHPKYNPERISQYNTLPGLIGVTLTISAIMATSLAITRERERRTMESLLATPVQPIEVMLGKLSPFVIMGYFQLALILTVSFFIFDVPIEGSLTLLSIATLIFIVANLSVGLMFSSIAENQLQALQLTYFFFLPSLMLSGFMFPFKGMPGWAQWIGEMLPLTHFTRISRGIILKGNDMSDVVQDIWPMVVFVLVVLAIGLKKYRRTLD